MSFKLHYSKNFRCPSPCLGERAPNSLLSAGPDTSRITCAVRALLCPCRMARSSRASRDTECTSCVNSTTPRARAPRAQTCEGKHNKIETSYEIATEITVYSSKDFSDEGRAYTRTLSRIHGMHPSNSWYAHLIECLKQKRRPLRQRRIGQHVHGDQKSFAAGREDKAHIWPVVPSKERERERENVCVCVCVCV